MARATQEIPLGSRFGRYTVIELAFIKQYSVGKHYYYRCQCDCAQEKLVSAAHLKRGKTLSCGCYSKERAKIEKIAAGLDPAPKQPKRPFAPTLDLPPTKLLYRKWYGMMDRCYNTLIPAYQSYGGRGIRVCEEWKSDRKEFYEWAFASGFSPGLTIERKDVDGDYCPENCCWIPFHEQMRNMRQSRWMTAFGETKLIADWARDPRCVVSRRRLYKRIEDGWSVEEAITTPKTR